MEEKVSTAKKCYNSWSCIVSCAIVAFVIISIIYDMTITKPEIRKNIVELRENVQELNEKIDAQTIYFIEADSANINK